MNFKRWQNKYHTKTQRVSVLAYKKLPLTIQRYQYLQFLMNVRVWIAILCIFYYFVFAAHSRLS